MKDWRVFTGNCKEPRALEEIGAFPPPPPWRNFQGEPVARKLDAASSRGSSFQIDEEQIDTVNAAIHLRRPLLVTGKPGTGKSSLAYAIAHELQLGPVLVWPITTRTTLQDGLCQYDAIGRLHQVAVEERRAAKGLPVWKKGKNQEIHVDVGDYLRLGPLGTALLPAARPRVLLLDEIDKSDVDFPNDLLHIFEEGRFEIPELARISKKQETVYVRAHDGNDLVPIKSGQVLCREFPIVVMTSNGERDFPPAFKRRCLRINMPQPSPEKLSDIVTAHLGKETTEKVGPLIEKFLSRRDGAELSTDQLLYAIHLSTRGVAVDEAGLLAVLFKPLAGPESV